MKRLAVLGLVVVASSVSISARLDAAPELMTPQQLMALPTREPDHIIRYGDDPSQFGELRVPAGGGPHPVVVLVHGGCWSNYAGARSIGAMADALKDRGIATWSIEFRRLPDPGSGWPGTYQDAGRAIDHLRRVAGQHGLNLDRVIFAGHSAGGHLALWAAARHRLAPSSPLYVADPLVPLGVVNMAGRMDMAKGIKAYEATCSAPVVRSLLGGNPSDLPQRYRDASPARLLPLGVPQRMIWGEFEEYVPVSQAKSYVRKAKQAGDDAQLRIVPGVGHFETASPQTPAWPIVLEAMTSLLERQTSPAERPGRP